MSNVTPLRPKCDRCSATAVWRTKTKPIGYFCRVHKPFLGYAADAFVKVKKGKS